MRYIVFIISIFCFRGFGTAQTPLVIEGINEIVRFQADLSQQQGGFVSFKSSPTDYIGYIGIHPRRPEDVEIGTTLGSMGNLNITIQGDPKLSVNQEGEVVIKNLQGSPNSLSRPVTVGPAGNLDASAGFFSATIPCNSFIADDRDGEYTKIVNPTGTVQFIQHAASSGELSAPIVLPKGVLFFGVKVYYVNLSSATSGFNFRILESPFAPADDNGPTVRSNSEALPKAGSFIASNGNSLFMDMGVVEKYFNGTIFSGNSLFKININCAECSSLFIRSVELIYTYP